MFFKWRERREMAEMVKQGNVFISGLFILIFCTRFVDANWWFLSQLQLSAVGTRGVMCDNIPGLVGRQRQICKLHPDIMISIGEGARAGVQECQNQFQGHRWNCTTVDKDATVFGKVMLKVGSREAAFVYSVSSAGVVHSITRACSEGTLINCACDPNKAGKDIDWKGEYTWGGCSDNVRYGSQFSRMFIDAREKKQKDARALMNLHNNRAGRKAVQKFTKLECKCHGVSGACTIRTCWREMQDFRKVGKFLKKKYSEATKVMSNQEGTSLIIASSKKKRIGKTDLVFLEQSPDYCIQNSDTGSLGTAGRKCTRESKGADNCKIMCCGRGYDTRRVLQKRKCECKFHWCCRVECQECEEWVDEHTCKPPKEEHWY